VRPDTNPDRFSKKIEKGQEQIWTKSRIFLKRPGQIIDSNVRTEMIFSRYMHLSAVILPQILLILDSFFARYMGVWTIILGRSRGGQVQSGQIGRASVQTKGASEICMYYIFSHLPLLGEKK
jgi:hypothetical protein